MKRGLRKKKCFFFQLSALIVEAQLYQQLQEQTAQLEEFRNKVQRRLRKQKQDTAEQTIIIEKHPVVNLSLYT